MKKLSISFLTLMMIAFFSTSSFAQQAAGQSVLGFHAGYSLLGALVKSAEDAIDLTGSADVKATGTPALQLAFDYGMTQRVSIGVAAAFQTFGVKADNYTYTNAAGETITENAKANSTRMSFAIRTLFHYGNSDRLDMYSGLRLQRVQWSSSLDSTDPDFGIGDDFDAGRFGLGIIPFGLRYYFTDALGAGFELMWGAPYLASLNVNYRLGEGSSNSKGKSKKR
jgi:hypothetical protein